MTGKAFDQQPRTGAHKEYGPMLAEAMIATIRQPVLVLNDGLIVEKANPAFLRLFQVTEEETIGRRLYELGNAQWEIPALRELLEKVIPHDGFVEDYRVEHEFEELGRRIMLLNGRRIDGQGSRPPLILLAISDITELEQARFELEGQAEYADKLIDSLREALVVMGWDLRVKQVNRPFFEKFLVTREETEGRLIYELGNGQWNIPRLRTLLEDILPKQESFDDFEVTHDFEGIGPRTMLLNARRLNHLDLILLAIEDVTERREAQRRQHVLISDLSHRVKNLLALVDSMASQTLAGSRSMREFREAFQGRLRAIARAHGQLFATEWTSADLEGLVRETLEGCAADISRVDIDGAPLTLTPQQAMALNLTLHELCTNAVKYGALSESSEGRVGLSWSVVENEAGRRIELWWRESNGPKVDLSPRKGFGTRLIESLCPYQLSGETRLSFEPTGLICKLAFPLS